MSTNVVARGIDTLVTVCLIAAVMVLVLGTSGFSASSQVATSPPTSVPKSTVPATPPATSIGAKGAAVITVKDTTGNTVAGCTVTEDASGQTQTTDAQGVATFPNLLPGYHFFKAGSVRYDGTGVTVVVGSAVRGTIVLYPGGTPAPSGKGGI